uniref:Uncharacterized protein n=1 Tax=Rhizophora mucronata TaxID=61149 RepID=A0A2P2N9P2_RHIMU
MPFLSSACTKVTPPNY